ncbi:MAG: type II secretion system F family protein [Clostridium sp.]|mgnify:CR=1 FL=1|jgi:tight adherence protein B
MKKKKEREPQWYMSSTNIPVLNYNEYYMKKIEWLMYTIAFAAIGAVIGYIFYGGIGLDIHGEPTRITYIINLSVMSVFGIISFKILMPMRKNQLKTNRKKKIRKQFVDMLESLSVSIAAGQNVPSAMQTVKDDLLIQYTEKDYIVQEISVFLREMENGIPIEDLFSDFGKRTGIEDISNFGKVFEVAYRRGGNLKEIVKSCYDILSEKIEIEMEIQTKVASSANQMNIMILMPIFLIAMLKSSGEGFAENFTSASGIISTTVSIFVFIIAYFVGRKILDIKA